MSIFPNPVADKFIIQKSKVTRESAVEISVYNMLGERVYPAVDCKLQTVDCQPLVPGIYWLLVTDKEKTWREKFVKE